jgi:hypothetical protein
LAAIRPDLARGPQKHGLRLANIPPIGCGNPDWLLRRATVFTIDKIRDKLDSKYNQI